MHLERLQRYFVLFNRFPNCGSLCDLARGRPVPPSPQRYSALYSNHFSFPELTPAMVLLLTLCLPLSVSITLSLIQMTVSLILNPIFGMITSAAILATSIFFNSQWILGNYLMVIRSQASSLQGLCLLCPILCAVSILIGYFYFQKEIFYLSTIREAVLCI